MRGGGGGGGRGGMQRELYNFSFLSHIVSNALTSKRLKKKSLIQSLTPSCAGKKSKA